MNISNDIENIEFLTSKQISKYLCVPLRTIQRLTKEGKLKGIKIGKQWRYKKSDIENYITFGTVFSKEPARKCTEFVERRTYPRINCSFLCYINVLIPGEKEISSTGRILNIGQGGTFIKKDEDNNLFKHIKNDDPIKFSFELNKDGNLEADGRILRAQKEGIAVKFKELYPNVRELIKEYVG